MLTNYIFVSVCVSVVVHLLLSVNNPPAPPYPVSSALVSFGLTAFLLPLCTNLIVTTLIAGRIWYLSPRKVYNIRGTHWQFPTGIGSAAINIVIESGMLYLAVQLIFVILIVTGNPAQGIASTIAAQIYVRIPHPWKTENSL